MTKHHLVQIEPVAIKARFCCRDSFSAGRRKSAAPASTTPHFITGALHRYQSAIDCSAGKIFGVETQACSLSIFLSSDSSTDRQVLPEVHRLETDRAVPHALEPALLHRRSTHGGIGSCGLRSLLYALAELCIDLSERSLKGAEACPVRHVDGYWEEWMSEVESSTAM